MQKQLVHGVRADADFVMRENIMVDETDIDFIYLKDLRAHMYIDRRAMSINLNHCPPYEYLVSCRENPPFGDIDSYERYHSYVRRYHNPKDTHNPWDFLLLVGSLVHNGYDGNNLIVVYKDGQIIRDGQHRAAAMLFLRGEDILIPVLKVRR